MGFVSSFCTHMRNRSFQYMVRSTYDLFENTSSGKDSYSYNFPKEQSKREKKDRKSSSARAKQPAEPLDRNGKPVEPYTCVEYMGEKKCVVKTTPKMRWPSSVGKKCASTRIGSCHNIFEKLTLAGNVLWETPNCGFSMEIPTTPAPPLDRHPPLCYTPPY